MLGKSEHEIDMQGNKIVTQHASSFATPYITAMVANLYKPGDDVLDMKHKLCSTFCDGFLELKSMTGVIRLLLYNHEIVILKKTMYALK